MLPQILREQRELPRLASRRPTSRSESYVIRNWPCVNLGACVCVLFEFCLESEPGTVCGWLDLLFC